MCQVVHHHQEPVRVHGLHARPRRFHRALARQWSDGADQAAAALQDNRLQPPLPQIREPGQGGGSHAPQRDLGERHHLCGDRGGRVLPLPDHGCLFPQDCGLGCRADLGDQIPSGGVEDGPWHNRRRDRVQADTPLGPGLPVLQRILCGGTEEAWRDDKHDAERGPA